jgi:hypothetical protein
VRRCPAPGLYGGYMGFWMFLKKWTQDRTWIWLTSSTKSS